jgi:hypothetical protein
MSVPIPFRRTCRQFSDGKYTEGGRWRYIRHPKFSISSPLQYIRAFKILQNELLELFEYIEPADVNRPVYSYKIHGLLMRVCIEIEANFRAIFEENGHKLDDRANIKTYKNLKIHIDYRPSASDFPYGEVTTMLEGLIAHGQPAVGYRGTRLIMHLSIIGIWNLNRQTSMS